MAKSRCLANYEIGLINDNDILNAINTMSFLQVSLEECYQEQEDQEQKDMIDMDIKGLAIAKKLLLKELERRKN